MSNNSNICLSSLEYKEFQYDETQQDKFHAYNSASHGMIFSMDSRKIYNDISVHANILMQVRSSGDLGFGGGIIDSNESPINALNREMREEFNIDPTKCLFQHPQDHICSHVNEERKFICHFYAKEVGGDVFRQMERDTLLADEFGRETFGILRVPLFIEEGLRGLPLFLRNIFSGNARQQLVLTLMRRNIIPKDLLSTAIELYKA